MRQRGAVPPFVQEYLSHHSLLREPATRYVGAVVPVVLVSSVCHRSFKSSEPNDFGDVVLVFHWHTAVVASGEATLIQLACGNCFSSTSIQPMCCCLSHQVLRRFCIAHFMCDVFVGENRYVLVATFFIHPWCW